MIRRILVPTDFSDASKAALVRAEELGRLTHAELILFHVRDELPLIAYEGDVFAPGDLIGQRAAIERQLRELAAEVAQRGLVARPLLAFGAAGPRIIHVAEQEQVDLIVMGTHGRHGAGRLVLGSVAERVARTAPMPVMVISASEGENRQSACRKTFLSPTNAGPSQTILVATDFEAASLAAVPYAFELAETLSARVHLLHVYAPVVLPGSDGWGNIPFEPLYHRAIVRVREVAKPYENSERMGRCIATMGPPCLTILETALELAADLIVVGTHGRTGLKHLLLGSIAEKVIREAPCPVVVTKGSAYLSVHSDEVDSAVRTAGVL